jgi:hypothetical protein
MNPESSPQFFRYEQKLTAAVISDPALVLICTAPRIMLLMARSFVADASLSRFCLQDVICLEGYGTWTFRKIPEVMFYHYEGMWHAEDAHGQVDISPPRPQPYKVVFISKEDHGRLQSYAAAHKSQLIIQFSKRFFPEISSFNPSPNAMHEEFKQERKEMEKHRWIESEKVGYDIGFERALTDWIVKHRSKWRKWRASQR